MAGSRSILLKPFIAFKSLIKSILFNFVDKYFQYGYKEDFQNIFGNAMPLIFGNLFQAMFQIVSILFCGHIGPDELGAASLAFIMINVCGQTSVIGLLSACDTIFPQVFAGKNKKTTGIYLQKALLISMIWCMPVIGILTNSRLLISLVEKNSKIVNMADRYVLIYLPSIYTSVLINLQTKYLQAQNIIRPLVIIYGCGLALHICLSSIFIFGIKMSVEGSALSVDLSLLFVAVGMFVYSKKMKLYEATWDGWTTACLYDWSSFLRLGIPGFLSLLFEWTNFEIGTFSASAVNDVELGVLAISQQVLFTVFMIPLSIGTSGNIRIGQLLGGNAPERAKNASKVLFTICFIGGLICCIFLASFSPLIPYIFSNTDPIIEKSKKIVLVCAFFHIIDASLVGMCGILRSVGAQLFIFVFMVLGYYVIGSPIGLSLLLLTQLTSFGYYVGVSIGTFLIIVAMIIYASRIDWNKEAKKAYELTLAALPAESRAKEKNINLTNMDNNNNNDKRGIENPNFNSETKIDDIETVDAAVVVGDNETDTTIPKGASLALALVKRILMFTGFFALFAGLTLLRLIEPLNHDHYNFSNETTNFTATADYNQNITLNNYLE